MFNAGKTQIIIMTPAGNRMNSNLEVDFNGNVITSESSARFLDITISDNLSWDRRQEFSSIIPEQKGGRTQEDGKMVYT